MSDKPPVLDEPTERAFSRVVTALTETEDERLGMFALALIRKKLEEALQNLDLAHDAYDALRGEINDKF